MQLGGFSSIDPLSGFFPQFPTGLGGFSLATWSFETYQLSHGARMFSLVTRFSFSVFHHLGWEVFHQVPIQGSHLRFPFKVPFKVTLQQIPRSAELASEERGNFNNLTFGTESSRSRSYVTTTNHNFTSSGLTSITTLGHLRYWVGGARFLLIYATE